MYNRAPRFWTEIVARSESGSLWYWLAYSLANDILGRDDLIYKLMLQWKSNTRVERNDDGSP